MSASARPLRRPAVVERHPRALLAGMLSVPFVIAAIVLRARRWNPVLDLAMTELRVRDVLTRHSPLIGLPGRIGVFPDQGSHPGPLSFYVLAPTYRLLGSTAWGLLVAMLVLDVLAVVVVLWLAERLGGRRLLLAIAALLVVVVRGYGLAVVAQPWNPYLPLLWWLVVLLATAGVLAGDDVLLVVVALAGSLCAQTHMPYLGLCAGLGGLGAATVAVRAVRDPQRRRVAIRVGGVTGVAALAAWAPVLLDQVRHDPGNLSMLSDYFRHPPEAPVGTAEGMRLVLRHLDVVRIARGAVGGDGFFVDAGFRLDGSIFPGALFLLVWLAGAFVAWRLRHRLLVALDATIAAGLVLATVSMGRIFGKVWYYLTLWAWTLTALMIGTAVWTLFVWLGRRSWPRGPQLRRGVVALVAVGATASFVPLVADAATVQAPEQHLSDRLRDLVGPTVAALHQQPRVPGGATYVVTWNDALYFGSQGYGLVSELERRGIRARVPETWHVPVTQQRVIADPASATGELRLATGSYIDEVAALPGAVQLAAVEPRNAAQLAEYARLDDELRSGLRAAGLAGLEATVDRNLFGVQLDPRVSPHLQAIVNRMLVLGQPEAVFLLPPGSAP